ncbi:hypothetical protein HMPREF1624_03782 [Sporothrix schenckii ATCC 58251]|uniref:gamma-glutamylcyclotransferase n=1 Tax=Sporothrix schenckii (strain ATCC 58251 / de Perez 2211183) TaxID=1391915 RepID=U7Q143_SPOS1|nr:hypothetical protein HMPREF1624_03782 [Sporothrix schenckii ATCC 58251]
MADPPARSGPPADYGPLSPSAAPVSANASSTRAVGATPPPRPARTYYLAYGSDMQMAYMARTCPGSRYIGRAVLTDYRWHINGLGLANLTSVKTAHAPGLVFELEAGDRAALETNQFPLYKSVTVDAELIPAPFCLYRRQATWITKNGGPQAVLEEAEAQGRGSNDRRASYTERGILVFISTEVTTDGRPDARYAEAINAAAADAMALGVEPMFFDRIVQPFMPGRILPILRVVRRGKGSSDGGGGADETDTTKLRPAAATAAAAAATPASTATPKRLPSRERLPERDVLTPSPTEDDKDRRGSTSANTSTDSLGRPEKERRWLTADRETRDKENDRDRDKEKDKEKEKDKVSVFGDALRSIFQRPRWDRKKESGESAESASGWRPSTLLTGSESDEPSVHNSSANNSSTSVGTGAPGRTFRRVRPQNESSSSSTTALDTRTKSNHRQSQSESSLVAPSRSRPPAPKITISRPSRHNTLERTKYDTDGGREDDDDGDEEEDDDDGSSDSEIETTRPSALARVPFSPPARPRQPPPERASPRAPDTKTAKDPSERKPVGGSGSRASAASTTKPPGKKRPSTDEVLRMRAAAARARMAEMMRELDGTEEEKEGESDESGGRGKEKEDATGKDDTIEATKATESMKTTESTKTAETTPAQPLTPPPPPPVREAPKGPRAPSTATPQSPRETEKEPSEAGGADQTQATDESEEEEATILDTTKEKPVEVPKKTVKYTADTKLASPPTKAVAPRPAPKPAPKPAAKPAPKPAPRTTPTPAPAAIPAAVPAAVPVSSRVAFVPRPRHALRPLRPRPPHAASTEQQRHHLRRPKSFCFGVQSLSRFDQFLLQAADHPHFATRPWLPAFQAHGRGGRYGRGWGGGFHGHLHGHFQSSLYSPTHSSRYLYAQTTIVATVSRERRMSF